MIRRLVARIELWFRIAGLRADIAGYQDDLNTIMALGQHGGLAHQLIAERLEQAQYELYLCTRQKAALQA